MAGIGDTIGSVFGSINPFGDDDESGYDPTASTTPTAPVASFNPLGELPPLSAITTKAQATEAKRIASLTRQIWEGRLSEAKLAGGGGTGAMPGYEDEASGRFYWNGIEVDGETYFTNEMAWEAANPGGAAGKSPELANAEEAVRLLDSYLQNLGGVDDVLPDAPKTPAEKAPVKVTAGQFVASLPGEGGTGGAYNLEQFLSSVLQGIGLEATPWRMNLMREWAKGEGTGAGFNPLATTQTGGENPADPYWNDNGGNPVKNYQDFATGVSQTVKTLTNGYYPLILQTLEQEQIIPGAGNNARTWGTIHLANVLDSGVAPGASDYAGANPGAASQYDTAEVQRLYDQYGTWEDVAAVLYSNKPLSAWTAEELDAPFNGGQSIRQYVSSAMTNLGNFVRNVTEGSKTPSGYSVTGSPSSGGGGGGSTKPLTIKDDPRYVLEQAKADESDRRYGLHSKRMSDFISARSGENALIQDIIDALADEATLQKTNQDIQDKAIETALGVNAAVKAGKADYYDSMGGAIWGNSLGGIQKQMEEERKRMQRAPEGFSESILATIPRSVPVDYYVQGLGLPGVSTDMWSTVPRNAAGTIPRYATGTVDWRDEPYIAEYKAGRFVPPAVLRRLQEAGIAGPAGKGATWKPGDPIDNSAPPAAPPPATTTTPTPGYIPRNATVPVLQREYDTNEWLDQAISSMARNISAGNSGLPAEWGIPPESLAAWHGVPPSQMDASFLTKLRNIILTHKDDPAIIQAFGPDPGIATTYVPDPNAEPADPEVINRPTQTGVNPRANMGYGNYGGTQGQQSTYSGTYGGGMDPYQAAQIGIQKDQLSLQKKIHNDNIALEREKFELAKIQDTRSAEYMEKQYQIELRQIAISEANQLLAQKDAELKQLMFEEDKERWEIENGRAAEKFELDKIAQEADLRFKERQLDLQYEAGLLDKARYEEQKRQFQETFDYQKQQDAKKQNLERAKTVAQLMANPSDVIQQQFFYAGMSDPVGTAYDTFTGENKGQKTWGEAYEEDAELWEKSMIPIDQRARGGYINDSLFMVGDQVKDKATGYEEIILNPTGAPLAVVSNQQSRQMRFVPPKGKSYRGVA